MIYKDYVHCKCGIFSLTNEAIYPIVRFMRENAAVKPAIDKNSINNNEQVSQYQSDSINSSPLIVESQNIAEPGVSSSNGAKPFNKQIKYTANQIAYIALREQGLSAYAAGRELGLSSGYPAYIDKQIKKHYDLTDTKLVRGAHKTIKNLSRGLPVGTIEKVKDSTALAAASMIYDRYQPAVHHSASITANISPVDMSRYMIDNQPCTAQVEGQSVREEAQVAPHDVPIDGGGEGGGRRK